ncbi:nuclear transport factor 2 family protein [Phenylobacterium sp.]|jgi:ketosteroid isomerase-like protein|uniref:nuclear transport factor 2 family protein n=1 Tax=Phenylobacterium sp. TaxID=1871053 RepID=UPI002F40B333
MIRFASMAAALVAILAPLAAEAALDPLSQPQTVAGVAATEAAWVAALKAHDGATLQRLLASDFVDTTWQGVRRDKAAALAAAAPTAAPTGGVGDQALSELAVGLYGNAAVVHGLNTVRGPDGAVRAHIRFTDVFVYRQGGWRAVSAQETLEQAPAK